MLGSNLILETEGIRESGSGRERMPQKERGREREWERERAGEKEWKRRREGGKEGRERERVEKERERGRERESGREGEREGKRKRGKRYSQEGRVIGVHEFLVLLCCTHVIKVTAGDVVDWSPIEQLEPCLQLLFPLLQCLQ